MMKNSGTLKLSTRGDREIVMTRVFDAPRRLVFDALTKPELLKHWFFGPPKWTLAVCDIDLRVGGEYRYVWRSPDGMDMGMRGVFREIVAPERIVATEKFDESWYPGEALDTTILTERDGKTTLTLSVLYDSAEAREAVLRTPMEDGVAIGYDRLAELLASGAAASTFTCPFTTAITATLSVRNCPAAIDFYKAAFDAIVLHRVPDGGVARLAVGGAEFWVAEESPQHLNFSPQSLGGCSVRMLLTVPDPEAVCQKAVAAGASQVSPVRDGHGWRIGRIADPFGHHWEVARELT